MNDLPNGHIIIIHHVKFERLNYFLSTLNLEIMSYMSIFTVLEIWQIQHHHQFNLLWFNMIFIIIIGLTLVIFCLLPTIHKMRDSQ